MERPPCVSRRNDSRPAVARSGKRAANREGISDLVTKVIAGEPSSGLVGKCLAEHLCRTQRRPGIADQRMRHRTEAARRAVIRGGIIGIAENPLAPSRPRPLAAHPRRRSPSCPASRRRRSAAPPWRGKPTSGKGKAHLIGVVRRHRGRAVFLQQNMSQGPTAGSKDCRSI